MMLKSGPTLLRGRTLHVPLPMLAMLSAGETAAIIGHELAHFATDTGYGMRFLPIYTGIERNLQALRSLRGASTGSWTQGPAITFWTHMMTVFDGAVKHWSRLREIEVDLAGARHSGAEMAVSALVRTAPLQPAVGTVLDKAWRKPGAAALDVVASIVARAEAAGLGDPAAALEERQPHPTDSHPPTSQRLGALGLVRAAPLLAAASRPVRSNASDFARGLFNDWNSFCATVSADAAGLVVSNYLERASRLREAAEQPIETVTEVFGDWRKPMVIWSVVATVFLGIGLLLAYTAAFTEINDPPQVPTMWLVGAGLVTAAAAAVLHGFRLWGAALFR